MFPLIFFISSIFLCPLSIHSLSSPEASSMQALKASLGNPKSLEWSHPNPCVWPGVACSINSVAIIRIGGRNLKGSLPPDLKNLSSLTILNVSCNQLTGSIPSLAGLTSLKQVLFHNNNFSYIPPGFFTGLTSLQTISLDNNHLSSWKIPESLKDASVLQSFSANGANLTGTIPDFLGGDTFPELTVLHLAMNNLHGPIPWSFAKTFIQSLWLNGQRSVSKLNGSIAVIRNMTSLTEVWLHGNMFTGAIPDLSGLSNLNHLSLRDNLLTGIVPLSVFNLPKLAKVSLTNNLLQGPTPKYDTFKIVLDMRAGTNTFCLDDPGVACDSQIEVLLSIVESVGYPVIFAQSWKGNDPCNKSQPWKGIKCEEGNITVVNFHNMRLSGTIPNVLTNLSSLSLLDVSNNHLNGILPRFRRNVIVIADGNTNIEQDNSSFSPPGTTLGSSPGTHDTYSTGNHPSGGTFKNTNMGIVMGSLIGAYIVGLGVCLYTRKLERSSRVQSENIMVIHSGHGSAVQNHAVESGNKVISIQVLRDVTNDFSEGNVLGRGGFGTVYKGESHDGKKIAVKRMEPGVVNENRLGEFKNEIAVLSKVRHRHLVALLGHCFEGNERLLVYEYMPQGTLSRHLFNWKQEGLKPLEWKTRLIIGLDVARGVEYLHILAHRSFIHRDLKPCNILLGDDLRAKVADFGLVRLAPENGQRSIETRVAGTFGYLAPEYAVTGRVTTKVDVFSFGVILLELITGRKAVDSSQPEEDMHLVTWFRRMHVDKKSFQNTIDQTLLELDEETLASVSTVAELALHCCTKESYLRPDMAHIVNVLSSLAEQWKPAEPEPDYTDYELDLDFVSLPSKLHSSTSYSLSPLPMAKVMPYSL